MPKRSALDWALLVTGGAALGAVLTMLFSRDEEEEARAAQQQAEATMQQSELRQGLVAARAELSELAKLSSQLLAKQQHRMDELEASLAAATAAQAPVTQADPTELLASLRAEVVPMVAAALDRRLEEQYSPAVEQQLAQPGEALHPPEGAAAALERYLPPAIAAALREERAKAELDAALEGASIASPVASNGPAAPASGGGAGASGGGGAGASGVDAAGGVTASGAGFSVTHATTDTPLAARPPLLPLTPLSRDALAFYPASASASASHSAPSAAAATAVTSTATATAAAITTTTAAAAAAAALPAVDVGQASAAAAGSCLNGGGPSPAQPSLSDVMRLMQARETLGPRAARLKPKPKPAP